jgi:hypothetical protein
MPKRSKTKPKQKIKPKHKVEPEPAITTKKSYWIILAVVLTLSSAVLGLMSGLL